MAFACIEGGHEHESAEEAAGCDANTHDSLSMLKMAQVSFNGPDKVQRVYMPGVARDKGKLRVVVFSEDEILPWQFEGEE